MSWGRQPWGVIGGAGGDDTSPPTVTETPGDGVQITPTTEIGITVTDAFLKRVEVTAEYPSGYWEVIYMQNRFASTFRNSTRQAVPGGVAMTIRRSGGWPERPKIHVEAYDTSSNEAGT
jgi:hypothetical protein